MSTPFPPATTVCHNGEPATADTPRKQRRSTRVASFVDLVHLFKAAGQVPTKTAARELLMDRGLRADKQSVQMYLDIPATFRERRQMRAERRFHDRFGRSPGRMPFAPRPRFGPLPAGTLADRLQAVRRAAILKTVQSCLRYGAAGGGSFSLKFADTASQVNYSVLMDSNRSTYRGSFKGWSAAEDHHRVCVPADWCWRVLRKGLAVVDGMMTLDAHLLQERDGVAIYAATWARQGRGYQVITERGFLATGHGLAFHSESAEDAAKGLERKLRAVGRAAPLPAMKLDVEGFVRRFSKYGSLMVSIDDARDTGACEFGIRSWCEAVGIDMEQQEVTMKRLLQGFAMRPQEEVRHTVLHAVRNRPRG